MFCLADIVRDNAAERPDKPALICDERTLTYAELDAEASLVANALLSAGVENQDRVGIIAKNIPEYFTLTYGAAKINAVSVAVNWRLAPAEMGYILDNAEVGVVLVENEFLGHLDTMELPRNPLIVALGGSTGHLSYTDWIADASSEDPNYPTDTDDTGVQLYTSGTTGLPKGAELSNRNFEAIMDPITDMIGLDSDDVVLHVLPMFHIGGSGVANVGLFNGCTNIVHRDVDPGRIFADIPKHGVTSAFMVPALLQVLPMIPGASDVDYSSLKKIFYGASPITEEVLIASIALLKCPHAQAYGLTETTGVVTWLNAEDHDPGGPRAHLLRSAGRPIDGVELRIVDQDTGEDLSEGEVGEIWVRTVQNLKSYWKNPEATAEVFPEGRDENGFGWFTTGDAGYMEDGFLFIHDRVKDMIVSGGENVYPAEIENAIMAHPGVADVAVIGVPSDRWGESPLALIIPAEGADPTEEELIAHCKDRLARFKLPTAVQRIDAIPRNPSGKILKVELRKPYWEGRDRSVN
ncbi:MAG: long-chain-fatty-acid--CoA ligase [Acidimicrobiaceae bacterium]|jgi:long-chain acyl-CoA synthetase|nr:long-chain-fatty-acid--CoA ligase [Acidimicrobiaceae bacterium]MBT5850131.1 long-chain-fatty-acid--CoA ligase [Acidimicrobiaceae bacterium]MDG1409205.1 long-chain-fatty-acid--CoA ligase [Acidimicrobiales bacterium]MDG2218340.1 long-chain-fatty-acid--CoA ligase [Acidimicrobiales bacterium]